MHKPKPVLTHTTDDAVEFIGSMIAAGDSQRDAGITNRLALKNPRWLSPAAIMGSRN